MTPEGKVKKQVKDLLSKYDVWYFMPVNKNTRGIPDFIGCIEGNFFSIETKAAGNKPTELQTYTMEKIKSVGGVAFVVGDIAPLEHWLNVVKGY